MPYQIRKSESIGLDVPAVGTAVKKKRRHNRDKIWNSWLEKLMTFKRKHGHCYVHRSYDIALYYWVNNQRSFYRNKIRLTPDRIKDLKTIGFFLPRICPVQRTPPRPPNNHIWNGRLEELVVFKMKHGHFNVPRSHDARLRDWVRFQRYSYRKKFSCLTPDRIETLRNIGFNFDDEGFDTDENIVEGKPLSSTADTSLPQMDDETRPRQLKRWRCLSCGSRFDTFVDARSHMLSSH